MARKHKENEENLESVELGEETSENTEELDTAAEPSEIDELDLAEIEAEEKPAPRRKRRKKAAVEAQEAAPAEETVSTVPAVAESKPNPVPETKPSNEDPMVRQWEAARQTTEAIVASLEKVNGLLKELPDHYAGVLQKSLKQNSARSTPGAKIAFGMSMVASVLSILSLSFSQSARELVLSREISVPAAHRPVQASVSNNPRKAESLDMLAVLEGTGKKRNKKAK